MARILRSSKRGRQSAARPPASPRAKGGLRVITGDAAPPTVPVLFNGVGGPVNGPSGANRLRLVVDGHDTSDNDPELRNDGFAAPSAGMAKEAPQKSCALAELLPRGGSPGSEIGSAQPHLRALQGRIEKVDRTGIEGWVWDPQAPSERIRLELIEGDMRLTETIADNDRPELVELGCGDGRHGFTMPFADELLSEGRHVLTLRCATTGAKMPGSPIELEHRRAVVETAAIGLPTKANTSTIHAYIDDISDTRIEGWITRPDNPSHRCTVALTEAGRVIARTVASRFRLDLLSAGLGDGCYSFVFEPPGALFDGQMHLLQIVDEDTGLSITKEPIQWGSKAAMDRTISVRSSDTNVLERQSPSYEADSNGHRASGTDLMWSDASHKINYRSADNVGTHILFDISDLVYYLGHHSNLTGIQRVQSSIVLAMIDGQVCPADSLIFLSFNAMTRDWVAIPTGFLISLLRDLFLPEQQRLVTFPAEAARYGVLPGARTFDGAGVLDDGNPSVLCLLGAAWVHQDYLHRVLALKRRFGTRFVMTIHDLIPIYARETCDQDTAQAFEQFMRRALRHIDHILTVSNHTAKDVRRYLAALQYPEPPITVTQNGSSFAEFLPKRLHGRTAPRRDLPERFVLFVATIEGRKNHPLMLEIWRRMVQEEENPPHLICVGRLGWKATAFVSALVETNYLDGRIHILREISDTDLQLLYDKCLFTVFPSFYERWGLTVSETLAMGKICVSSDRSSIPEVAGGCGVYIDIDSADRSLEVIRNLIRDNKARKRLEAKIRREYVPITWRSVARNVVAACEASADNEWQEPYPYAVVPYSTEIGFGRLDQDVDGTGEALLSRIIELRRGHFTFDLLNQQSFLLGEDIRSGGSWANPERWGTWLCHSGGDIAFSLAADASQNYYVFLRIRVCGELHDRPIRLLANGDRLWKGVVGHEPKDIVLRVRKGAGATDQWRLQIGAEVDLHPELRAKIASSDNRVPTIGFERLIVVPEGDVKTRLDVLTTLLM
jgi:glycosyltransferase involved in cell wall biosynthesis